MPEYNIAGIKTCTEAEGPFRRTAIWFQGCDIRCRGCCNPGLQGFRPEHIMSMEELLSVCLTAKREMGTEGVTLLGGEPTLQDIAPLCLALRRNGLGTILFTGRLYDELNPSLRSCADLVVDGPYDADSPKEGNLIGSRNQRVIDVTGRYTDVLGWFTVPRPDRVEISLDGDSARITGDVVL